MLLRSLYSSAKARAVLGVQSAELSFPFSPSSAGACRFCRFCPSSLGSVFLALFVGAMRALQVVAVQASAFLASAYQGVVGKLEPFSQALIKALKLNFGCSLSRRS